MPNLIVKKPREQTNSAFNCLVSVETNGEQVAQLKDGSVVGEISFITDGAATVAATRGTKPGLLVITRSGYQNPCSDLTALNAQFINAGNPVLF